MTMIVSGSTGLEFPDGSDQTSAFTGNAASITSGTLAVARGGTGLSSPGDSGNVLTSNGTSWTSAPAAGFPTGTVLIFGQTSAPTGWTKDTSAFNNSALRVVTGSVGSGGSVDFTTAFASQTPSGSVSVNTSGLSAGATTLSTSQIPSHNHTLSGRAHAGGDGNANEFGDTGRSEVYTNNTSIFYTGGGGSHSHSISGSASASFSGTAINLAVKYVDVIRATKD
jgi:hypothetical protein